MSENEKIAEELTKAYFSPMMQEDEKPWKFYTTEIKKALDAKDAEIERLGAELERTKDDLRKKENAEICVKAYVEELTKERDALKSELKARDEFSQSDFNRNLLLKDIADLEAERDALKAAISDLDYECQHVKDDVLSADCVFCDLAVARQRIKYLEEEMRGDELYNKWKRLEARNRALREALENIVWLESNNPDKHDDTHDVALTALGQEGT